MAGCWLTFWAVVAKFFEDVPRDTPISSIPLQPVNASSVSVEATTPATSERSLLRDSPHFHMSRTQWGVAATMGWWAMCSFFLLGSWESMIPVFTSSDSPANPFSFSPFAAGNMIALGGACTIPFLLLNLHYGRRMQDRITLAIGSFIGMAGLLIAMSIISTRKVNYGSFFVAWFLVALGFNVTSTVTIALLSKQLPPECEPSQSHSKAYDREWSHQSLHPVEQLHWPCYGRRVGRSRCQDWHVGLCGPAARLRGVRQRTVLYRLAQLEGKDGLKAVESPKHRPAERLDDCRPLRLLASCIALHTLVAMWRMTAGPVLEIPGGDMPR